MADFATLKWRAERTLVSGQVVAATSGTFTSAELDYSGTNGCQVAKLHIDLSAASAPTSGTVSIYWLDAYATGGNFDNPADQRLLKAYDLRATAAKVTAVAYTPGPYSKIYIKNTCDQNVTVTVTETRDSVSDTALT